MKQLIVKERAQQLRGVSRRERLFRTAAALSLGGMMTLTALATGTGAAHAQTSSPGTAEAALAPETTVFYFGVSLDTSSAQWQVADGLLAKLGVDNGATDILNSVDSDMTSGSSDSTQMDTAALLGGEAAVIVTNLDSANTDSSSLSSVVSDLGVSLPSLGSESETSDLESTPTSDSESANTGTAIVVSPRDLAAATKAVDDQLASGAAAIDAQVQSTTYNGVTIKSYPGDDDTGDSGGAYAVVGQHLVLAETPGDVEPIIDTSAGTIKPLSGVENFGKADQALAGDRLGFGFINGSAISSDMGSLDSETSAMVDSFGSLLGLNQSTGLSLVAADAGFEFNTVAIPNDGSTATAGGTAADLSLASKVPADTLLYANGFDAGQGSLLQGFALYLVSALNTALNPAVDGTPAAVPSSDTLFENAAQILGFNLKLDFIDQLVGQYALALWNVDMTNPTQLGMIFSSDVTESGKVSDALSKLSLVIQAASTGMANVTTESIGDSTVSVLTIGDGTTSPSVTIDYGVVDGKFMFGTNDSITQFQSGFDDSLADSADFKAGLAALPSEYDGVFYVNMQDLLAVSSSLSSSLGSSFGDSLDNSPSCAKYATQADAQAAYDADSITNYDLDLNFNGTACEDYFSPATPTVATPEASQYPALKSFTLVSFKKDGLSYTSSILTISDK